MRPKERRETGQNDLFKAWLDQIVEAHRYLESNEQIGKIVVTI